VSSDPISVSKGIDVVRPSTGRSILSTERDRQVLDAAAQVFAEKGYDAASLDDIADVLSATKGLIYYYYRSKSELLRGVLTASIQGLVAMVKPVAEESAVPADERLRQMARIHALEMMTNFNYQFVNFRSLERGLLDRIGLDPTAWRVIRDMRTDYEKLFLAVVEEGCSTGVLNVFDVPVSVRAILGSINWLAVWYRPGSSAARRLEQNKIAEAISRYVVEGVRQGI
jgi:AcrR family transcriptional regulator